MGSYSSCYHIAEDHINTDITTYNIEEQQQKYRLGTVNNRLVGGEAGRSGGGGGLNHVLLDPSLRPYFLLWFENIWFALRFLTQQ